MPTIHTCPDDETLERLARSQLPEPVAEVLERELNACPHCTARLDAHLAAVAEVMKRLPHGRDADPPLDDLVARVKALARTSSSHERNPVVSPPLPDASPEP